MTPAFSGQILIVEDEIFTRTMLIDGLTSAGVRVRGVGSVAEALAAIEESEPNVLVCDLNLGRGPSGAALLERVAKERPWIGLVALTSQPSPELAVSDGRVLPDSVIYVVKSSVGAIDDIVRLAAASIEGSMVMVPRPKADYVLVSRKQGELLRMIAEGLSNAGIAAARGITARAAESQVQRLFLALGLDSSSERNVRVEAARMWHEGRVGVRD
jgi:DNA-binding NarL/FixJ family response regulator